MAVKLELKRPATQEANADQEEIHRGEVEGEVLKDIIEEKILGIEALGEEAHVVVQGLHINSRILVFPEWALNNTWFRNQTISIA